MDVWLFCRPQSQQNILNWWRAWPIDPQIHICSIYKLDIYLNAERLVAEPRHRKHVQQENSSKTKTFSFEKAEYNLFFVAWIFLISSYLLYISLGLHPLYIRQTCVKNILQDDHVLEWDGSIPIYIFSLNKVGRKIFFSYSFSYFIFKILFLIPECSNATEWDRWYFCLVTDFKFYVF